MNSIDYSYRPKSYFGKTDKENGVTQASNWNFFRDEIHEQDDSWKRRIIPVIMPGNLPPLMRGEVEIASICLDSVNYDTDSIRARKGKERIRYRFLDEYNNQSAAGKASRTSIRPLTLGELLDFIFRAHPFFEILDFNFPGELEERLKFFIGESKFYPQFHDALVEKTIEHFFNEHCPDNEESREDMFYSLPEYEEEEEENTSSGCERTIPGLPSWIRTASEDDPIYRKGFVFGGTYSSRSRKNDPVKTEETQEEPMTIEEKYEEAALRLMKEKAPKPEAEQ